MVLTSKLLVLHVNRCPSNYYSPYSQKISCLCVQRLACGNQHPEWVFNSDHQDNPVNHSSHWIVRNRAINYSTGTVTGRMPVLHAYHGDNVLLFPSFMCSSAFSYSSDGWRRRQTNEKSTSWSRFQLNFNQFPKQNSYPVFSGCINILRINLIQTLNRETSYRGHLKKAMPRYFYFQK